MKHLHTYESFLNEALAKPDQYYVVVYMKKERSVAQEDFASKDEADAFAKAQALQKNTYAYVFDLPKDKNIFEEYLAILPFKMGDKSKNVGWGIYRYVDLFNKSALKAHLEESKGYLITKKNEGSGAGFHWQANINATKRGIAAVERWISVIDQLPPSELNRSNDNYDAYQAQKVAEIEAARARQESLAKSLNPRAVIGRPVKLEGLEIAENDFPKALSGVDAVAGCTALGSGWRLPTLDELELMYKNKDKIGGFKEDRYWSSMAYGGRRFMTLDFTTGKQSEEWKEDRPLHVRVVKG